MEERLKRLEEAVEELRSENAELRRQVQDLREQTADLRMYEALPPATAQRRFWAKWSVVVLVAALITVPILAYTYGHINAFWSTAIGALNGLVLYIVGPGAWRLLIEGLFRAIPAVLFGQAARVAVDTYRKKRAR